MRVRYFLVYLLSLITRFFPLPATTGIVRIGKPDQNSPVLVTGNYLLTVEILKKELQGLDLFLLVADSGGINVWCAATGGHFTNHQVIAILKTSGIDKLVDHKTYILPQLAATGIEPSVVKKKTGWNGEWGPVSAEDIPDYLEKQHKTTQMKTVSFTLRERLAMAIVWAFPMSIIFGLLGLIVSLDFAAVLVGEAWVLSFFIFGSFSSYEGFLQKRSRSLISSKLLLQVLFIGIGIGIALVLTTFFLDVTLLFRNLMVASVVIMVTILFFDMNGNTPTYKSDHHEERVFDIRVNEDACRGVGDCILVCPKNCFEMNETSKIITIPRASACVQCGACIVQCPFDALYFENQKQEVLEAETIRKYRLNLMGRRTKQISEM